MVVPDPHAIVENCTKTEFGKILCLWKEVKNSIPTPSGATLNATGPANAWLIAAQMVRAAMAINCILDFVVRTQGGESTTTKVEV